MLRNHRCILLLSFLVIGNINTVLSQKDPFVFRHITMADGLAGNDVRSIIQDNKGFMWLATDNGLQRYDGYAFNSYHHNPVDSLSISSDNVLSLFQDRQNYIWVISFLSGVDRFNPSANKCLRIGDFSKQSINNVFNTGEILMDANGNIWLIGTDKIACYNTQTNHIVILKDIFPKNFRPNFRKAQYDAINNQLWLADSNNGICMYDLDRKIFYCRENNPADIPVFRIKYKPLKIYLDRERNLWIQGYTGYFAKYNLTSNTCISYNFYKTSNGFIQLKRPLRSRHREAILVTTISEDSHKNIWIVADPFGLIQYIPKEDSFRAIPSASNFSKGLYFTADIHCVFEDREGNIWVGTDKGINIFNPFKQQFHFFENDPDHKFPNIRRETTDFLETNSGELWVASFGGGLTVFDRQLNPEKHFIHQPGDPNSIGEPANHVWSLVRNSKGNILVGCQYGLLCIIDPKTRTFANYHPKELHGHTIMNMNADKKGNIWMALYYGIAKWNEKKNEVLSYQKFIPYRGIDSSTATDVLPDDHGNVWVGTSGLGLQKFDVKSGRFTEIYVPEKNNTASISSAIINCVISISDSTMAIATGTGGIDIFNTRSKQFIHISASDGLPANNASSLYFDPPFNLWSFAGNILCKINLQNKHIACFGPQDGITDIDPSSFRHMYRMRDGRIMACNRGGFFYFLPDSVDAGGPPPNVSLTNINVFDKPIPIDSFLQKTDTLTFSYKQNFITIQYASLSYWESDRINYSYMLDGVDKNWVNAHSQHFARYTNLPGGTYKFKVKCENSDGVSCNAVTSLVLVITPPFWQTLWFKMIIAFCLALSVYALYRNRINQFVRLQAVRNEISKDLHDDVGSTLSSISILSQVAKNKMDEGQQEQSSSIMEKINSYSQEMVEKMGDIVWAVNAGNNNIGDIVQRLKGSFMEATVSKNIQLQFSIDPVFEKWPLPMQVRKNMYLICKEAVNNAIKYANCSKISVSFRRMAEGVEINITDDGKGFDTISAGHGNGLVNMKARAIDMKATLKIESGTAGTIIALRKRVPRNR